MNILKALPALAYLFSKNEIQNRHNFISDFPFEATSSCFEMKCLNLRDARYCNVWAVAVAPRNGP